MVIAPSGPKAWAPIELWQLEFAEGEIIEVRGRIQVYNTGVLVFRDEAGEVFAVYTAASGLQRCMRLKHTA